MSSSEAEAQTQVPKVLARNSACHQCRKRKLKCDALRPICTNCTKPRPRANPNGETECTWDDTPGAGGTKGEKSGTSRGKRRRDTEEIRNKRARLQELEERVSAFEKTLRAQLEESVSEPSAQPSALSQLAAATSSFHNVPVPVQITTEMEHGNHLIDSNGPSPASWILNAHESIPDNLPPQITDYTPTSHSGGETRTDFDNMSSLVWPDWPIDLPSLETVEHVVGVFFDKVPTVPKMLHKASFLASLLLPPSHPNFPSPALIHGILGLTAPHLPSTLLASRDYFPVGTSVRDTVHPERDFETTAPDRRFVSGQIHYNHSPRDQPLTSTERFQMWHRRKTFQILGPIFDTGERLVQAVQALICATTIDAYNAWWTDLWMESGSCLRMCVPLRLNETIQIPADAMHRNRSTLLAPPNTDLEQASRERTWWMAYLTERTIIMSTSWPESLHDCEITVELPVAQATFDSGVGDLRGVQTIHSPDFFSSHPDTHADGLVFYLKALKLYTDISRFFRQYGRGSHSVAGYLVHPQLRVFFSQINAFRLSFPAHLRRPASSTQNDSGTPGIDVDLIAAICVTHGAMLAVGEPVITKELYYTDVARMSLSAIRAVLSLLYDITSTSFDLSLLPYTCSYMWFSSGKGLIRFIDAATQNGDFVSAAVYRSELEVFRMALKRFSERHPTGNRHLNMLDELVQLQAESSSKFATEVMISCSREKLFDPTRPAKSGTARSARPSSSSFNTPSTSVHVTPSAGTAPTPAIVHNNLNGDAMSYKYPSATFAGPQDATPSGFLMMNQEETWEGMADWDVSKWFDIPNLSYDESNMGQMVNLAKQTGLTFNPEDFRGVF